MRADAVKVALPEPAGTATDVGTVTAFVLLLESETVAPLVFVIVTVQVLAPPDRIEDGLHTRLEIPGSAGVTVRFAESEPPFNDAVIAPACSALTVPAVALKVALLAPAATTTDAGTASAARLLSSATAAPPVPFNTTVQVLESPAAKLAGLHWKLDKAAGVMFTLEENEPPFSVAVIVPLWAVETAPAEAVKLALVAPAPIVTEEGTVRAPRLLDSSTVTPPVGAADRSVTVQVMFPPQATVEGVHCMPASEAAGIPITSISASPIFDPTALSMRSCTEVVILESRTTCCALPSAGRAPIAAVVLSLNSSVPARMLSVRLGRSYSTISLSIMGAGQVNLIHAPANWRTVAHSLV